MKLNGDRSKIMEKKEICSKNGNRPLDYVLIWANYILWIAIILFCLLFAMVGHCATESSTEIPYNVSEMQSYNQIMLDRLPIAISEYRRLNNLSEDVPLLVWTQDGFFNDYYYQYYFMQNPEYNNTIVEGFDFSSSTLRFTAGSGEISYVLIDVNGQLGGSGTQHSTIADLCGTAQSVPTSQGYYLPRYPFFYNGDPVLSNNNLEVLINRVAHIAPSGTATEPDLTGDNIGNDKPDIDDYLPSTTNPPAINNNSLEDLVESLFDLVLWQAQQIIGLVKGIGEFLGDTITYSIQKIIDNIKNGIKNLFDNFKSLFEPLLNGIAEILSGISSILSSIKEGFDFLIKPFDEEEFEESWNNCQFISAVENIQDGYDEFKKAFQYAEERNYYTLYMGFMFTDYTVNAEFDFTWLYPLRPIYRPLLWGFVVYEMFVYMCSSFSDWLAGRSGNK